MTEYEMVIPFLPHFFRKALWQNLQPSRHKRYNNYTLIMLYCIVIALYVFKFSLSIRIFATSYAI